jgi:hypothetical protein
MNKKLRAEIDYINMLLIHFLLFISALFLFKHSFSNVLNGIFNFKTQIAFLIGLSFITLILFLILSLEYSYYFKEKTVHISFVLKKIEIEYSEIEFFFNQTYKGIRIRIDNKQLDFISNNFIWEEDIHAKKYFLIRMKELSDKNEKRN